MFLRAPWRRPAAGPRSGWRGAPAAAAADGPGRRLARGTLVGILAWLLAARLGILFALGLSDMQWLPAAALLGALLGVARRLAVVWAVAGAMALLLVLVTATPMMRPLLGSVLRRDADPGAIAAGGAGAAVDAIVVLSSAVMPAGLVAGQGLERLLPAVEAARRTGLPLVVTIVHPRGGGTSSLADQRRIAELAGVGAQLVAVDSARITRDEAVLVGRLARTRGWRRVALITSPAHARRACAAFERAGLPVLCTPAPSREVHLGSPRPLAGADERARAFGLWLYETLGWWSYRARGWA